MKRILLCLACAFTILLSSCNPASVLLENPEKTERPRVEQTEAPTVDEADEREALVKRFLVAYFKTQPEQVAECVPSELQSYMSETTRNAHWDAQSIEITLSEGIKLVGEYADRLTRIEERYTNKFGLELNIEEAYIYQFDYKISWGGDSEEDGGAFDMFAVKIDGVWYAIPADL